MKDKLISANTLIHEMRAGCVPVSEKGISGVVGDDDTIEDYIANAPAVDAIPVEWLIGKAAQAERDLYYCKGDAEKNADIMAAVRVVMGMWKKEGKDA